MSYTKIKGPDLQEYHSFPHRAFNSNQFQKEMPMAYVYDLPKIKSEVKEPKIHIAKPRKV